MSRDSILPPHSRGSLRRETQHLLVSPIHVQQAPLRRTRRYYRVRSAVRWAVATLVALALTVICSLESSVLM